MSSQAAIFGCCCGDDLGECPTSAIEFACSEGTTRTMLFGPIEAVVCYDDGSLATISLEGTFDFDACAAGDFSSPGWFELTISNLVESSTGSGGPAGTDTSDGCYTLDAVYVRCADVWDCIGDDLPRWGMILAFEPAAGNPCEIIGQDPTIYVVLTAPIPLTSGHELPTGSWTPWGWNTASQSITAGLYCQSASLLDFDEDYDCSDDTGDGGYVFTHMTSPGVFLVS